LPREHRGNLPFDSVIQLTVSRNNAFYFGSVTEGSVMAVAPATAALLGVSSLDLPRWPQAGGAF
jgi:hypothetical protein